ncbi:MAG: hypothetical protein RL613_1030 [Fusobacteriota bacterium]
MKGDKEMDKIIKKVNEYAKLSKERELTEEEKKDRDNYRKVYMDKFRQTRRGPRDNITIVRVDENGNKLEEEVIENTKYN